MKTVLDQLQEHIHVPLAPKRIISLVPSQTELLADLGLAQEVIGITRFCVHPAAWHKTKSRIGGTKNFLFNVIDKLQPDLIIGNKEENYKEGIAKLKQHYTVWMSNIVTWQDALSMIEAVGEITNKAAAASAIQQHIEHSFSALQTVTQQTALYLIWKEPWMAAGSQTFIDTMLKKIGFKNCLEGRPRYPILHDYEIKKLLPNVIFLSSEPYPFKHQHIAALKQICPSSKIICVDGQMFSWYGSRLMHAPAYFNSLQL